MAKILQIFVYIFCLYVHIIKSFLLHSDVKIFPWDKEKLSPNDYQQNYCTKRCNGSMIVEIHKIEDCLIFLCFNCDCTRPSCEIYDTCCPDISELQFEINVTFSKKDSSSLFAPHSVLTPKNNTNEMKYINIISDILNDTNEVTVTSCTGQPDTNLENSSEVSSTAMNDLDMSDVDTVIVNTSHQLKTAKLKILCDDRSSYSNFLYVRSCPPNYPDQNMTRMCELELPTDEVTEMSYRLISDKATNVVYYNQFCARCNGVNQLVPWSIKIECEHFMRVYKATNADEFLRLSLQHGSQCYVQQNTPAYMATTWCDPDYFREDIIDTCETFNSLWTYDEDVKRACEGNELSSLKYRVETYYQRRFYKNIFCAICNEGTYPRTVHCFLDYPGTLPPFHQPAFSFLLGVRRPTPDVTKTYTPPFNFNLSCSDAEWPSPNGDCLALQCSPGKVLEGNTCRTGLDFIKGLGYNIRLWLTAETDVPVHSTLSNADLLEMLKSMMTPKLYVLEDYNFVVGMAMERSQRHVPANMLSDSFVLSDKNDTVVTDEGFILLYFWIEGYIIASNDILRDVFEQELRNRLFNCPFEFQIRDEMYQILRPSVMPNNFVDLEYCYSLKAINDNIECLFDRGTNEDWYLLDEAITTDLFLTVSHILNCSYIRFNSTQYEFVTNNSIYLATRNIAIMLDLGVTNVSFSYISDFNMLEIDNDGTLKVCQELLDKKLLEIDNFHKLMFQENTKFQEDTLNLAKYILTLICLSVSILCLALTLLTYLRFNVLRNVAGIHNIFLCTSLLLAQGSLLAASHLKVPSVLCTALGISTHFLWLCHFCWSFVCCYHMFKVFTSKTRNSYSTASSRTKQLVKNVVLTTLVPALIVTIVIIVSYLTSETSEIGYGHIVCYLDYAILLVATMIAPLALVTLTNIIFFIITVVKIHNVRKLQTHFKKEDRQNVYVYIKLSTMTGALWLVSIIGESFNVDALRFIAILLNGLQGVFIFISYICNKRVLNLYLPSLGLKTVTLSPKTDQSTLSNLAPDAHLMPGDAKRKIAPQIHSESTVSNMEVASEVHQMSADDDIPVVQPRMLNEISAEDQTRANFDERKVNIESQISKTP